MEYLVRLVQLHESFRRPELEALACLADIELDIVDYRPDVRQMMSSFSPMSEQNATVSGVSFLLCMSRVSSVMVGIYAARRRSGH